MKPKKEVIYSRAQARLLVAIMVPLTWFAGFLSAWMHAESFERAGIIGFFAVLGSLVCVAIYRMICGRFWIMIPMMAIMFAHIVSQNSVPELLWDLILSLILMYVCLALFVALYATMVRVFFGRNPASSDSPLADPEIDARPIT